ncbi:DUF4405 domain-containing protein [bacterium]|nr:DUF4405 domain-containing protein [bacterium]
MSGNKFKLKVLTSFVLTFTFFAALVSGLALYLSPKGRIANWIHWTFLNLDKEQWADLHTVVVTVMLIAGILHLFWFNWKVFWSYLITRSSRGIRYKNEFALSIVLTLLLIVGSIYKIQPIYSVVSLSGVIDTRFEIKQNEPPVPHAEDMSLEEFAASVLDTNLTYILDKLHDFGLSPSSEKISIGELAAEHNLSPNDLYRMLDSQSYLSDAEELLEIKEGGGYGMWTYQQALLNLNVPDSIARQRLADKGIQISNPSESISILASRYDKKPIDLIRIIADREK